MNRCFLKIASLLVLLITNGCHDRTAEYVEGGSAVLNVAIFVYPGVELLDFAGPAEVFSNAKGFRVYTVAADLGLMRTEKSVIRIYPDYTISNAPQPDIIVLPGAPLEELDPVVNNREVINWIKEVHKKTKLTMSVCTGAQLLSKAGILDYKTVTTHAEAIDTLQRLTPNSKFVGNVRFVEHGKLLSTAGVSAGIDGALHVVAKYRGMKEALFVSAIMEYDKWDANAGLVVGKPNIKQVANTK
ncbi:DJ-1/PfpI family protein [Pedobacter cryoconitis]|uniref:DJ-1/PfpI family protein n=1 Tax=Pedobacter cryoconitis TaxID=188932 RepID=UPI0016120125|nr:DJ-1/PfpI family protein [Pedobacter cryoconitis]MBB5645726.1 transcriptional regulator GlxA family with amidase domain [Pedobacter cryoconitis]